MDSVNVRNLEQIQEDDADGRSTRAATLVLAGIGGAALVVAAVLALRQSAPPSESKSDPLAALVQKARRPDVAPPDTVDRTEATFPSILSDSERPTIALAAVKDERGRLVVPGTTPEPAATIAPPPPADKLPVVPLPAGTLLDETAVTREPKDSLTALAVEVSKVDSATPVMPGGEGGFQIQVASFKEQAEADQFVLALRKRGYRAYRQPSYVSDRGLWHRVRIGPFKTKLQAEKFKAEFDRKERMSTFLVDPDKVKRQEEARAGKAATHAVLQEQ
jgi:cell division septation protein DedD